MITESSRLADLTKFAKFRNLNDFLRSFNYDFWQFSDSFWGSQTGKQVKGNVSSLLYVGLFFDSLWTSWELRNLYYPRFFNSRRSFSTDWPLIQTCSFTSVVYIHSLGPSFATFHDYRNSRNF